MAKTAERRKTKDKTKVEIGAEVRITGGSKGGGRVEIAPTVTIERERRRRDEEGRRGRQERIREVLLDLRLEEVTAAARRIAAGDRVSAVGAGPRLVVLSPHGTLGLASIEASEMLRAALAAAPGADLECRVVSADGAGVSVRATLLRPAEGGGRAPARGTASRRSVARRRSHDASPPPAEERAAVAAAGRRGR